MRIDFKEILTRVTNHYGVKEEGLKPKNDAKGWLESI